MTSPSWFTAAGTVGTFVPGTTIFPIQLVAYPVSPATTVSYSIVGGQLPNGLTMNSSGLISGTVNSALASIVFNFVIRATDNLNNVSDRAFSITISNVNPIWVTADDSIGVFPAGISMSYQLIATPVLPATRISYSLISGSLPDFLVMDEFGTISGIPDSVAIDTLSTFVIRATDNLGNIRDRTFTLTVTGSLIPVITTVSGVLLTEADSSWMQVQLTSTSPENIDVFWRITQGSLPPGVEMNDQGLIRGYAQPPVLNFNATAITTTVTATNNSNIITGFSTTGFVKNRPISFSGTSFGNLIAADPYYVREVISPTQFTISTTVDGPEYSLINATGFMTANLSSVTAGRPCKQSYSFTVELETFYGTDTASYSIIIYNWILPISQGGFGFSANTKVPTILNIYPLSFDVTQPPEYYAYYIKDPVAFPAPNYIGAFESNNFFSFKVLGYDFDGNQLQYNYSGLPLGLIGDASTGWVTGTPIIASNSIATFNFAVTVSKVINPSIKTVEYFSFTVYNNISGTIDWITPADLGIINNGTVCTASVVAETPEGLTLTYVTSDMLPPNVTLSANGDLDGIVAYQPTSSELQLNEAVTYTFTVIAYSESFPTVSTSRTFTLTVNTEFVQPTDTLYMQCTPSIADRYLLRSLLDEPATVLDPLIPTSYLYRPTDPNFGKARSVIYAHAYGIDSSNLDEYVAAVTKNHYWRDITLGEIETAQARNEQGEIIYEVVYSRVIDNLVNPDGISISEEILWPRPIDLHLGPWYTSVTDLYTSYGPIDSVPTYYTSLTSGSARVLYPNSLPNMRDRVGQVLGQEFNAKVLPPWMTSQQENGSTTGFVPAWVICYTKPGYASIIANNIKTKWKNEIGQPITLNLIDFQIDRFYVDKSISYDYVNQLPDYTVLSTGIGIDTTTIVVANTYLFGNTGYIKIDDEIIQYNVLDRVTNTLSGLTRGINGTIPSIHQAGSVVKLDLSYWGDLPSATPPPTPIDSQNFYVLFPRKTILPDQTQY